MFHLKGYTTVTYKRIFTIVKYLRNPNAILDLKPESKYLLFQNIMEALNGDLGNMGTRAWFISGGKEISNCVRNRGSKTRLGTGNIRNI